MRDSGRHARAVAALIALAVASRAAAQVPGSPVLQNAFANPGLAVAANVTGGGGQSFFGAAAGYGMGSGRLQLSGAAGVQRASSATRGAYGARLSATAWTSAGQGLAVGAFAGFGGAARTRNAADSVTNPAVVIVPVGLTVGYRRSIGATRGISVYGSPLYRWTRAEATTVSTSGKFGGAAGLDVALTQSFGATIGAAFGAGGSGSSSTTFGLALSFVPGR